MYTMDKEVRTEESLEEIIMAEFERYLGAEY